MGKFFRVLGIGFSALIAIVLIFTSFQKETFLPAFWGLLIVAGLYRYLTKAKALNKYMWLLLVTFIGKRVGITP